MKHVSIRSELQTSTGANPALQITSLRNRLGSLIGIATAVCLYILLGLEIIPYAGIQTDEVIFAAPLYLVSPRELKIGIFHHRLQLMLMSYLGTLKTLLYLPILRIFGANVWSLRLPMLLVGCATIFMLYNLARRTRTKSTVFAATLAAILLASDPAFLFTNTMDWGPVALEHFLLVTGCFFLVKFGQEAAKKNLALGFFLFGLALWNKAIFLWALAGISTAAILVFWPEIRRVLRPATAAIAIGSFLLGALPLVIYNVRNRNATLSTSGHFDFDHFAGKENSLRGTLDGSMLFGFLVGLDDLPNPKPPASMRGRIATWIGNHTGQLRRTPMAYADVLALLLIPWWWKSRAARFSVVFMCVAWLAMAVTRDAGGSMHHSVLLWPFPQLFLAIALASLPWRRIASTVAMVLLGANLLLINQAVADSERNGAPGNFSDASFGLARAVSTLHPPVLFTLDWGIVDMLVFTQQGRVNIATADSPLRPDAPTEDNLKEIERALSNPQAIYVTHTVEMENYPEVRPHLNRALMERGFRKEMIAIIPDSNARPVFEIFRVVPMSGHL